MGHSWVLKLTALCLVLQAGFRSLEGDIDCQLTVPGLFAIIIVFVFILVVCFRAMVGVKRLG